MRNVPLDAWNQTLIGDKVLDEHIYDITFEHFCKTNEYNKAFISLMISGVQHLFLYLLSICTS